MPVARQQKPLGQKSETDLFLLYHKFAKVKKKVPAARINTFKTAIIAYINAFLTAMAEAFHLKRRLCGRNMKRTGTTMPDKTKIKMISLISAAAVATAALFAAILLPPKAEGSKTSAACCTASAARAPSPATQAGYRLQEYDGRIGIFAENSSQPEQVLNTYVQNLPQEEQDKLRAGIHVSTKADLLSLIEDYTS